MPADRQWTATDAGAHLRGRKNRDTRPEMALRRLVHHRGMRYRVNQRVLGRCRPDLVFSGPRVAVFVDGCYWHGCPEHGPTQFRGPNADLWRQKIRTNRERDRRNDDELAEAGWTVLRVWECELKRNVESAAEQVERLVRS